MEAPLSADNYLVLAGHVVGSCEIRFSPAGLPIVSFTLEHHSQQWEADRPRQAHCRIRVLACGQRLVNQVAELEPGTWVRAQGFLSRANSRYGQAQLVLHVHRIETENKSFTK